MGHIYAPFDLKIKQLWAKSATITWDLDNTVEFREGVYYKIYTSSDGESYSLAGSATWREYLLTVGYPDIYVKVTAIVPILGESNMSEAFVVPGLTSQSITTNSGSGGVVVVGPDGAPSALRTSTPGTLWVTEAGEDGGPAADVLLQQAQIAADASHAQAIIDDIREQTSATVGGTGLIKADGVFQNVGESGVVATFEWNKKSIIKQLSVVKEGGTATVWTVEVYSSSTTMNSRTLVFSETSDPEITPTRLDLALDIPYISFDDAESITVKVSANSESNTFYMVIVGELAA